MSSRKTLSSTSFITAVLTAILATPGNASAAFQMDFYTYGGFGEVVDAFNKCALIQSSSGIQTVLAAFWIGCLAFMMFSFSYSKILSEISTSEKSDKDMYAGPKGSFLGILFSMIFGAMLYGGLVRPTGTIHIYDKTENQYQAVGGVPIIVIAVAGMTNLVERAFIEMAETAGDPLSFSKQGGIKGIMVMNSLMLRGGEPPDGDATFAATLDSYTRDCVMFELARTGQSLSVDELKNKTSSVVTSFAKAVNPSNTTTIYDSANPGGVPVSCTDAWTNIDTRMTSATGGDLFKNAKKRACKDAGYQVYQKDASKGDLAYLECVTNTDALIKTMDAAWSLDKFVMESVFVNRFWTVMSKEDPSLYSDRQSMVRSVSSFQEYMQSLASKRGYMIAVGTAALPFVMLLLATAQWYGALGKCFGFYLLPAIWGILMAIVSDFFLSSAVASWSNLLGNSWGVSSYDVLSSDMAKQMNWWGVYLVATFGLAMAISNKIGGLSSMAGGGASAQGAASEGDMTRGRIGAGAQAKMDVATGEGMAKTASGWASGYAMAHSMPNMGGLVNHEMASQSGRHQGNQKILTGFGYEGAADLYAGGTVADTVGSGSKGQGMMKAGLNKTAATGRFNSEVDVDKSHEVMSTGVTAPAQAKIEAAPQVAAANRYKDDTAKADEVANVELGKRVGAVDAEKNMYNTVHGAGKFAGTFDDWQRQRQSTNGNVAMDDGSTLSITQGKEGNWQATSTFKGEGYTGVTEMKDGKELNTMIKNGEAWSATFGSDGHVIDNKNAALSGSIDQSAVAKVTESAGESWKKEVGLADSKSTSKEHSAAVQNVTTRAKSYAKEVASATTEKLIKSGAISKDERAATEKMLAAQITVDPIKTGALMATVMGGAPGAAVGGAVGSIMTGLGAAIGLKTTASGTYGKNRTSGTTVTSGLQNANEQSIQNALKEAITESASTSKTLADIKKESLSKTHTDSNGHSSNYGKVFSYDESKGVTVRGEMVTAFVKEQSELPKYSNLSTEQERIAAANNDISKLENRDKYTKEFGAFLGKKAMEDGQISGVVNKVGNDGAERKADFEKKGATTGKEIDGAVKSVKGPGSGPKLTLAPQVHRAAAQTSSDVNGGAVFIAGSGEKIGMFNSNPPTPEGYGRQKHASPSVELGTNQLKTVDGQREAPPTDFERVKQPVVNGVGSAASAVYNSTPVQTAVKIVGGVAGSVGPIMQGLSQPAEFNYQPPMLKNDEHQGEKVVTKEVANRNAQSGQQIANLMADTSKPSSTDNRSAGNLDKAPSSVPGEKAVKMAGEGVQPGRNDVRGSQPPDLGSARKR